MDIEQLKLILEMVQAAGEGAFIIAIIYFVYALLKFLLAIGLGFTILFCVVKLLKKVIEGHTFSWKIADLFGVTWEITNRDKKQIIEWIVEHKPPQMDL